MIPLAIDPVAMPIAVAGRGPAVLRRAHALQAGGAADLLLYCDEPLGIEPEDGVSLLPRLPDRADLAALRVLWVAGLPDPVDAELAVLARSMRVLVNVEDRPGLCDFHSVAEVRRGELLLTVSTGGASPGLAARIRSRLDAEYGPEWADRVALLRRHRAAWRQDGRDVTVLTDALLRANGWAA